ncbi:MAG: phytanoyl-CoA dioxygenase family protein [Bryobacteraceae bacterium]
MVEQIQAEWARQLDETGYVKIEGFLSPDRVEGLRARAAELFESEGDSAGAEFRQEPGSRRLANCVDKGQAFVDCIADETVLGCVEHVLGPRFKLSSVNMRSANPHNGVSQPLHCDTGELPDAQGNTVCNTVWLLDDFTVDNGALRVVPGSHLWGKLPQEALEDPAARHPDEVLVTGRAGDLVVMNAHLWHGGTANETDRERRALHVFYCRADRAQQQYQKRLVREEVQAGLTDAQRKVLALDDPLNDELSTRETSRSGFLK